MTLFKRDLSGSPARPSASDTSPKKKARSQSPARNRSKSILPKFLRQTQEEISQKFRKIELLQKERFEHAIREKEESPWAIDQSESAMLRNRYMNISPWTANRIKLNVPETYNDYINASPIVLERTKTNSIKHYIATQGPRQLQAGHIWRMVHEQTRNEAVVVMLTRPYEGGREKCFEYYPSSKDLPATLYDQAKIEFGDDVRISVELLDITYHETARTDVRKILLKVEEPINSTTSEEDHQKTKITKRIVWHLCFKGWPDWSVPSGDDKEALLELIRLANMKNGNDPSNPLIIHCSAGVGRSGTFITLDHFLTELEDDNLLIDDGYDPIFDIVNRLREQRMFMVQSEPQFLYIYKVIREKFLARYPQSSSESWPSSIKETFENARRLGTAKNGHVKPLSSSNTQS